MESSNLDYSLVKSCMKSFGGLDQELVQRYTTTPKVSIRVHLFMYLYVADKLLFIVNSWCIRLLRTW